MNKQEAIEKLKEVSWECEDNSLVISLDYAQEIISQIDEQQKVTIPKFLADWLEERKIHNWDLPMAFSRLDHDRKVGDWAYGENGDLIPEKVDMIARAWLDGYEVEKEKLYTVVIPDPHGMFKIRYLYRCGYGNIRIGGSDYYTDIETHLTEAEIKKDFEWAWQWAKEVE